MSVKRSKRIYRTETLTCSSALPRPFSEFTWLHRAASLFPRVTVYSSTSSSALRTGRSDRSGTGEGETDAISSGIKPVLGPLRRKTEYIQRTCYFSHNIMSNGGDRYPYVSHLIFRNHIRALGLARDRVRDRSLLLTQRIDLVASLAWREYEIDRPYGSYNILLFLVLKFIFHAGTIVRCQWFLTWPYCQVVEIASE